MQSAKALLGGAAAALDRAVVRAIQARNRRAESGASVLSHDERMIRLATIEHEYAAFEPGALFPAVAPASPTLERVRATDAFTVVDASWPSAVEPLADSVRDAYAAHAANRTAHARLFLGGGARPAVLIVHGYLSGAYALEERIWPIAWLVKQGFDVALAVLPFHAQRGRGGPPPFPGPDPRFTNEGFRQAIGDLRALAGFLRGRGAPSVGAIGMSLGGYTVSLLATLDEELSFVVPMIPLASLAAFAREQGRLGSGERAFVQQAALERANRVVSPFARAPRIASERVLVIGAESDRITPIAHAERLAAHFGAPLERVHGGHLMQLWRRDAFRATKALWKRVGVA